jgi:Fe-S cluster assembly protein SufB
MATPADLKQIDGIGKYKYGFSDPDVTVFKTRKGLDHEVVRQISAMKEEPEWMLDFRLRALDHFFERPMPDWGGDLSTLDLDNIYYYVKPSENESKSWEDVDETIKSTFDKLGIPEAEQKFLAGVGAQYESEMVYHSIQEHLDKLGVIFVSIEDGLKNHEELFREYFGTVIPHTDNKFAALNSAVWSGGSFVYVPAGVKVELPLQAYFRMNTANLGQFERTLIILEEGAEVHYVEGCTAPIYTTDSFHSGVIEIVVKKGARSRYTTIQNWSVNVYNLVTQRAMVHENAKHEWVDANLGSQLTMKYPSCYLVGEGARQRRPAALPRNRSARMAGALPIGDC